MHKDLLNNEFATRSEVLQVAGDQGRWSTRITAGVLIVQTLILAGIAVLLLSQIDWTLDAADAGFSENVLQTSGFLLFAVPIGLILIVSAVLCLMLPSIGWIAAMVIQCVILFLALAAYFIERLNITGRPWLLFVLMLSAILVVAFLNSPEGRLLLVHRAQTTPEDRES